MSLKISFALFASFFSNVLWASLGNTRILSDVEELILLSVSVLFFVVGILHAEAQKN